MTISFPATIEGLTQASEVLEKTLVQAGCPPAIRTKLMIVTDEIASNIVHYSGAKDFTVEIDFPENPDAVRVSFSDNGKAFDPLREAAQPDITAKAEDRAVGGLGLFMVKKMMDNVSYAYENGRNLLTVSKLRG